MPNCTGYELHMKCVVFQIPYKLKCHEISADQKQLKIHFYIFTNICIIALALNYLQLKSTWRSAVYCINVHDLLFQEATVSKYPASIRLCIASSSCCRAMKSIYLLMTQNLWATEPFISTSRLGSPLSYASYASQVLSLRLSLCS